MELVKLLPVHRYSVVIFFKFWTFENIRESRIPLKPVIGGMRSVALSISSHEQAQKTYLLFSNIVGSLYFRRIQFFRFFITFLLKQPESPPLTKLSGSAHDSSSNLNFYLVFVI